MDERVTSDEIRRLLCGYAVALEVADSLPPFVRMASRPRRWTLFEFLRRLPRFTVGTSTMATYHVRRSTTALIRRYDRLAATRGLTDDEQQACGLVKSFRDSLVEIRWKLLVPAFLVAAVAALQIAPWVVGFLAQDVAERMNRREWDTLIGALTRWVSSAMGADSFNDLLAEIGKAGPGGIMALLAMVVAAAYLVLRPLSPVFRIKRVLFNLAPTGHIDLAHTTTTWNAARSSGLYDLERALFGRLGVRAPREIDLDLWLSAAAAGAWLTWFSVGFLVQDLRDYREDLVIDVAATGVVVGFGVARAAWLIRTARSRRRPGEDVAEPAGFLALNAERIVEARSVVETAALGALLLVPPLFLYCPSVVWVRLVRERRDLERAARRTWGVNGRLPSNRIWPALGSTMLFGLIPAVPVAIHLTKLKRLQEPGVGSAGRTRAWLVPVLAAATAFLWFDSVYVLDYSPRWWGTAFALNYIAFAVAFGAVQHEQNALVRHVGKPLPCDDPSLAPKPAARPERAGAAVWVPDPTGPYRGTVPMPPQSIASPHYSFGTAGSGHDNGDPG